MCSDFNLPGLLAEQGEDAVREVLTQRVECGFNMHRVFTDYDIVNIGKFLVADHPEAYAEVYPRLVELAAEFGSYINFVAYTGYRTPTHWDDLCWGLRDHFALVSVVNEWDRNGRQEPIAKFAAVPWLLCSRGSNQSDAAPPEPPMHFGEYHIIGSEWWRKVGHNAMELSRGPMLCTETTRFPENDRNPQHAYDAAAGAALLCAGSTYHSVRGKTSQLWEGDELACAQAWADGARSVNLEYQDGSYVHATNEEGPDILRAYKRVLPGRAWTVLIRK